MGKTLAEKVWDDHVVRSADGEPDLLFIDLHLIHEVTSPQAFDGLRLAGRKVRRPDLTLATEDHNVPTLDWDKPIADPVSRTQVETLRRNAEEFGVRLHPLGDIEQGIVHVVGPQLGLTQPGMTIVCGDSHTSTHGAFGAIAFGIGTSEVEHVLATQTLTQAKPKTMAVTVNGSLPPGVTAKDLVLTLITHTGTGGGQGYIVEYRGQAIEELSMEGRMTVCNMSIEWGAKAGLIAPDQTTFDYIKGRPEAPKGADWDAAVAYWKSLVTDDDAEFDKEIVLDASEMTPFVTWGTNPGQGVPLGGRVPDPGRTSRTTGTRIAAEKALEYMALEAGTPMREVKVDTVFVGSCTNGRIEDLRLAAEIIKGRHVDKDTRLLVVPGSVRVRLQAEDEGLDVVFKEAGGEWRGAGCSMCLGMNPDQLTPGERSASTSNRNFEGRQGKGGRTHLVSVPVAAATAVRGTLSSPADLPPRSSLSRPPAPAGTEHHGQVHHATPASPYPLRRSNVDTDQIIPAVYLKRVTRTGFEDGLFAAWRNDPDVRAEQDGVRRRLGAGRGTRLRHRLVARARRVGPAELRFQGCHLLALRRHLPWQLRQEPDCSRRRSTRRSCSDCGTTSRTSPAPPSPSTSSRRRSGPVTGPDAIEDSFDIDDYTRWRLLEGLDDIAITPRSRRRHHGVRGAAAELEARDPLTATRRARTPKVASTSLC